MTDVRCWSCSTPISSFSDSRYCPACQQVQIQKEMAEQQKKNFEQQQSLSREAKQNSFKASAPPRSFDGKTGSGIANLFAALVNFMTYTVKIQIDAIKWCHERYPRTTKILVGGFIVSAIVVALIDKSCNNCASEFLNLKRN